MNRFSQLIISTETGNSAYYLFLVCEKDGAQERIEIFRSMRFGDWSLFEISQIRSNAERIFQNFLRAEKPEVLEFPPTHNRGDAWVIDQGTFPRRGFVFYDRRVKY